MAAKRDDSKPATLRQIYLLGRITSRTGETFTAGITRGETRSRMADTPETDGMPDQYWE